MPLSHVERDVKPLFEFNNLDRLSPICGRHFLLLSHRPPYGGAIWTRWTRAIKFEQQATGRKRWSLSPMPSRRKWPSPRLRPRLQNSLGLQRLEGQEICPALRPA